MDEWNRALQGEQMFPHKDGGGHPRPPKYGRPPPTPGSWQPTVPYWEKKFCTSVCLIPWGKLCETKKVMSMYKNVVQWDDSAGEEAFQNAKARFWAEMNGLPCGIPLPNPDMYIDEINWDSVVDPQLVADLDKEPPPPNDEDKDEKPSSLSGGWDSSFLSKIPCSGWGDAEDPAPMNDTTAKLNSSWDMNVDHGNVWNAGSWDVNGNWGNACNYSGGWGGGVPHDDSWVSGRDNSWNNERDNSWKHCENRNNEPDRRYGRKRDGGRFGPRNTSSRYQGDDRQTNNSLRNCRGRKKTYYPYEHSVYDKPSLAVQQWNTMQFCGPTNHQGSAGSAGAWHWEKPVS